MADVDIDPFGEHESRPKEPTDEHIPLDPVTPGRSTWEPDRGEQETAIRGESQRTKLMKDYVRDLYKRLSENIDETLEPRWLVLGQNAADCRKLYSLNIFHHCLLFSLKF